MRKNKSIITNGEVNNSIILNLCTQKRDLRFERIKLVEHKRNLGKQIYTISLKIEEIEKEIEKRL